MLKTKIICKQSNGNDFIAVVSGCFIKNNDKRPFEEGVYNVILTDDTPSAEYFDGEHWIIDFDKHPVKYWWLNYR